MKELVQEMNREEALQGSGQGASDPNLQTATFAAGCFWGVEEAFRALKGVKSTRVGYTGGKMPKPTYEDVCTDETGHAEAIEIRYDTSEISYDDLLQVFWSVHDPTTKDRQGPDIGSQYRSMIAFHSPEQRDAAKKSIDSLERSGLLRGRKVVTDIVSASEFYPAEEYHQRYYEKRGGGSCYTPMWRLRN